MRRKHLHVLRVDKTTHKKHDDEGLNMIRKLIPAAFAAALLMSMQIANAGVLFFSASLTGAAEDPPAASGG